MPDVKFKAVDVVLPTVKLRIEDLSYLRGLLNEGIKCHVPDRSKARLRVLGLIEDKELPACPKEMREFSKNIKLSERMAIRAVRNGKVDWGLLDKARYARPNDYNKPKPRKIVVITKAGMRLIQKGAAKTQVQETCK